MPSGERKTNTSVSVQVSDGHKFWEWMEKGAIPAMFFDQAYNGKPTIRRDRAFLSDSPSFRVGAPRLRQLRVVPGDLIGCY